MDNGGDPEHRRLPSVPNKKDESTRLRHVHSLLRVSGGEQYNEQEAQTRRKQIFNYYDTDSNGELDSKELANMLRDMYIERIRIAEKHGASVRWVKHAIEQADQPNGKAVIKKGVNELLTLRDANSNGSLDWDEFSRKLSEETVRFQNKNRYWRLAPLADIPIYVDTLANGPYHIRKILLAGATAGVLGKTVSSPLSRLTILQQTGGIRGAPKDILGLTRYILATDGYRGLMRGNSADILRQVPYSGSQYIGYEILKENISGRTGMGKTPERMLSGGLAGALSIALTFPLDTVRARMAIQTAENLKYRSIYHTFSKICREEGVGALYKGCGTAIAERFPNMAINFGSYEVVRGELNQRGYSGMLVSLICGGVAGIVSTTLCFPLDLVMRNLQTDSRYTSPFQVTYEIYASQGLGGFYRGLQPQLIKALPYTCTVWIVYEQCKRIMHFEVR